MTASSSSLSFFRGVATLVERLASRGIVVRRVTIDWAHMGSWAVDVSQERDEARRGSAIRRAIEQAEQGVEAFGAAMEADPDEEPEGPRLVRAAWDGKEGCLTILTSPSGVFLALNQWEILNDFLLDDQEEALTRAERELIGFLP